MIKAEVRHSVTSYLVLATVVTVLYGAPTYAQNLPTQSGASAKGTNAPPPPDNKLQTPFKGPIFSPEFWPDSTSDPNARCKTSKLTQEKLLNMIQAIVRHGNLTDEEFVEKTLEMHFGPVNIAVDEYHASDWWYHTPLHDAPITVDLEFSSQHRHPEIAIENHDPVIIGSLGFDDLNRIGANFHDCRYLTRKQVEQTFGGAFHDEPGTGARVKDLGNIGKNGTNITISYSFNTTNDAVENINISQETADINTQPKH